MIVLLKVPSKFHVRHAYSCKFHQKAMKKTLTSIYVVTICNQPQYIPPKIFVALIIVSFLI